MSSPPVKLETKQLAPPSPKAAEKSGNGGERTPTAEVVSYHARGFGFFQSHHEKEGGQGNHGNLRESWWGERTKVGNRPWHNSPKRRKTIPPDQEVAYERTKAAMMKVASSFLHNAADVTIEALGLAASAFEYVPILGLGESVRVLLSIWQAVQAVETNRLSCLRLNERCATILFSVRVEIDAAGPDVAGTLSDPIEKLTDSFRRIEHFVHKQVTRPFLKRYLKRDEDARKATALNITLTDSVGLFSMAIQIRTLKEIHEHNHVTPPALPPPQSGSSDVLAAIAAIRAAQAAQDSALDVADLYATMRNALRTGSDVAMLEMLQVNRGEIQEAIKTLQRALEDPRVNPVRPPQAQRLITPRDVPVRAATMEPDTPSSESSESYQTREARALIPVPPIADDPEQDAAFHREFLESGLDALRRLSGIGGGESLPPWTITRWEVDREGKIGVGFFSDVYKGVWRGRQVAIKILAPTAPRKVFRHEAAIWAALKHKHVLELLGASSATGDPPWFFVSPYMKNGTLVSYLKGATRETKPEHPRVHPGPLQMMHEIAVGMAYLHRKGVLHGDLKANNVLIDDDLHCVISDFGQSEMRSEVYRLSRRPQPRGTLRWQAPEIISGESVMTPEVDVYAFAIVCVEILTNGDLPWPLLDDQAVQQLVLRHNKRPRIPQRPESSPSLVSLIEACWGTDPLSRPLFDSVARGLGHLVGGMKAARLNPSPQARVGELRQGEYRRSPDMAPDDLPDVSTEGAEGRLNVDTHDARGDAPVDGDQTPLTPSTIPLQHVLASSSNVGTYEKPSLQSGEEDHDGDGDGNGAVPQVPSRPASSIFVSSPEGSSDTGTADYFRDVSWDGYESPPPKDARIAARRDERRYRLLLQHNFHPTLNLPLWEPSPINLGAVGYLSRPRGRFVTLFNSFNPSRASDNRVHALPSIYGYGAVREATSRQDKRNIAQIGLDYIQGLLTFKRSGAVGGTFLRGVKKRYSFPLRAGHKHAYLCTENATYRYMVDMDAAKSWFKANVRELVRLYGREHNVQREDLHLVVGTLETRDYGLFVSHEHPDGQVHFNVYADRREGQEWGSFSTDTDLSSVMTGPDVNAQGEATGSISVHGSKISKVRAGSDSVVDAVLLARLRFKPDEDEPTRL